MAQLANILQLLLPILYGGLLGYFGRLFFRQEETGKQIARIRPIAYLTVLLHVLYIGSYTVATGHELVSTIWELFSLIAFTLFTVYTFIELKVKPEAAGTSLLVTLVAFVLQLVSSFFVSIVQSPKTGILMDPVFNAHVTTSVFGYAALMLSAIYGTLYLLLFRSIRQNQFGALFHNIPSLEHLERFGLRSTAVGFCFLTVSIVLGGILIGRYPPAGALPNVLLDPKILMTLLVWLVFGVTLLVRQVIKLEGRRLVLFWMSGFALTIVSMTLVNAFGTQFHSFM
jgi:HemX protein